MDSRRAFVLLLALWMSCLVAVGGQIHIPRACSTPETNKFPFCNPKLSLDDRIKNLISLLHEDEKPPLLTARMSPAGNVSRIGLPEYDWGANCIHGVQSRCGTKCPTSFPNPNALGATFNMSLVQDMGAVIGLELRALWLEGAGENHANNLPHLGLDCWSPNININRDPRWGRNQEVPSEDPYLAGRFGVAYTVGLQNGTLDKRFVQAVVTLKHWDAYSLEDWHGITRHNFDAKVSQYDFTDTYFPAFKASVVEGKALGVMCAYNSVNGVPSCANTFLLQQTLRDTWGFQGYVTSDSGAVQDIFAQHHYVKTPQAAAAVAIKAGTDINSGNVYLDALLQALSQGLVTQADIDLALYRTLRLRFLLGLFDPIDDQPYWHVPPDVVDTPESQALNLLATQEAMVLLKNDHKTLPFSRKKNIAVVGPHGNATTIMVGNYIGQICPGGENDFSCIISPYDALVAANQGAKVTYNEGCTVSGTSKSGFAAAVAAAKAADYVVMILGLDESVEREGHDRTSITLPGVQDDFAQEILNVGKPTVVVLMNGGTIAIEKLKSTVPAILEAWYPGFHGGTAIASVLFGDYNPGGKLPVTVYDADYINQVNFTSMSMTAAPGRSYRYYTGTPLYPFGYGLSYTTFKVEWSNNTYAQSQTLSNDKSDQVTYKVKVTNTGDVTGDEVVQAYYSPSKVELKANPLIKQLFGFQRVHLTPGQSVTLTFQLGIETLALTDEQGNRVSVPGTYSIIFTNGVDQTVSTPLHITGASKVITPFGM